MVSPHFTHLEKQNQLQRNALVNGELDERCLELTVCIAISTTSVLVVWVPASRNTAGSCRYSGSLSSEVVLSIGIPA